MQERCSIPLLVGSLIHNLGGIRDLRHMPVRIISNTDCNQYPTPTGAEGLCSTLGRPQAWSEPYGKRMKHISSTNVGLHAIVLRESKGKAMGSRRR